MRNWALKWLGAVLFIGAVVWFLMPSSGFSEADVVAVKKSITEEFAKKFLQVNEVSMVRENSRKLIGFVKLSGGGLRDVVTKSCTATMTDNSKDYIWRCE
jgi:hypothetical protein